MNMVNDELERVKLELRQALAALRSAEAREVDAAEREAILRARVDALRAHNQLLSSSEACLVGVDCACCGGELLAVLNREPNHRELQEIVSRPKCPRATATKQFVWLKYLPPVTPPDTTVTADDLAGVPDGAFSDGDLAFLSSTERTFQLHRESTATPDGVTVIATSSGNGRWIRAAGGTVPAEDEVWIDPQNGRDDNDGTREAPLATWSAYYRRSRGVIHRSTRVILMSDGNETIAGEFDASAPGLSLVFSGRFPR